MHRKSHNDTNPDIDLIVHTAKGVLANVFQSALKHLEKNERKLYDNQDKNELNKNSLVVLAQSHSK